MSESESERLDPIGYNVGKEKEKEKGQNLLKLLFFFHTFGWPILFRQLSVSQCRHNSPSIVVWSSSPFFSILPFSLSLSHSLS